VTAVACHADKSNPSRTSCHDKNNESKISVRDYPVVMIDAGKAGAYSPPPDSRI
jgi:putative NADH-flavin reductase